MLQKINLHLSVTFDITHTHIKLAMLLHHHTINILLISMPIDNRDNLANRVLGNTGKLIIWIFFQDVTNYSIITRN